MQQNTSVIQYEEDGQFHTGHLKAVLMVAVLLLGISWMKNPQLFSVFKNQKAPSVAATADMPRYYAYVTPSEYTQPMVAGASTQAQGPMIINEDGSVSSVSDVGQVLGASTENIQLSLDQIQVKEIPDSDAAIKQYFTDAQNIESDYINNADFETALSSGNQKLIDSQAQKLTDIQNNLQKLSVPASLVKLQKLKIAQYQAGVGLLNNFTKADDNPELVGNYLSEFLKSQQDMDAENQAIEQKFGVSLGYPSTVGGSSDMNINP